MFNLFKKDEPEKKNNLSLIAVASLLIHSAKIDEKFTNKERQIIQKALVEMGADPKDLDKIIKEAEDKEKKIIKNALIEMGAEVKKIDEIIEESEKREKDSNQILDFTREIKNINVEKKKLIIEALWNIIYSDQNADMYETNLMRRLSGLLYLDNKIAGDIKKKIKAKFTKSLI